MFTQNTDERSLTNGKMKIRLNPIVDLLFLAIYPRQVPADSATVGWIKRHPILAAVGLAYGLTWLGLIPIIRDPSILSNADISHANNPAILMYAFLGVLGCLWAALIVASAVGGVASRHALLRRYLQWQVGIGWYLVAIFAPALVLTLAIGLDYLWTGNMPAIPAFDLLPSALVSSYAFLLIRYVFGNFEEICWRASVLPRLQARYSALISSVIVGFIQGIWHLPFLFVKGHYVQRIGLAAIVIQSIAMGIVATWIYNNTRGSLLMVALFHAAYDALSGFQNPDLKLLYLCIGIWIIAAISLVFIFGARHLSHKPDAEVAYAIVSSEEI